MKHYQKNNGFTLIELLVVVLIIGILSAIALPQYTKAVEKSRAAEALVLVRAIADAEERYFMANGDYTPDITSLDLAFPTGNTFYGNAVSTKNFDCRGYVRPTEETSGMWKALALCNRLPSGEKYAIAKLIDGRLVCGYYNAEGKKFCNGMAVDTVGAYSSFL